MSVFLFYFVVLYLISLSLIVYSSSSLNEQITTTTMEGSASETETSFKPSTENTTTTSESIDPKTEKSYIPSTENTTATPLESTNTIVYSYEYYSSDENTTTTPSKGTDPKANSDDYSLSSEDTTTTTTPSENTDPKTNSDDYSLSNEDTTTTTTTPSGSTDPNANSDDYTLSNEDTIKTTPTTHSISTDPIGYSFEYYSSDENTTTTPSESTDPIGYSFEYYSSDENTTTTPSESTDPTDDYYSSIEDTTTTTSKTTTTKSSDSEETAGRNNYFDMSGNHRKSFAMEYFLSKEVRNMACSPVSALMPLAKLALGAEGDSEGQLMEAIGVSKSKLSKKIRKMIKNLKHTRGVRLNLSSIIYVSKEVKLKRRFKRDANNTFGSTTEYLDFKNQEMTSKIISEWVTKESGKALALNFDYVPAKKENAIIINVVTFMGDWERPFNKVSKQDFHSLRGIVSVPMMTTISYFNYVKSDRLQAQIIEIPYMSREASFVLVLPDSKSGLSGLLQQIRNVPDLLSDAMKTMIERKVTITMPRFNIKSRMDIIRIYKTCGVWQAFDEVYSGLNSIIVDRKTRKGLPLIVTSVTHLTSIDVNEYSTAGAVATAMKMEIKSNVRDQLVFYANHPFLFYVKSKEEQLFAGTFAGY